MVGSCLVPVSLAGRGQGHLGDLGHELEKETVAEIGPCDVLLVPVGGFYTIGPAEALKVCQALKPRLVIPMHYKTRYIPDWPIGGPESFLDASKKVKEVENSIDLPRRLCPTRWRSGYLPPRKGVSATLGGTALCLAALLFVGAGSLPG